MPVALKFFYYDALTKFRRLWFLKGGMMSETETAEIVDAVEEVFREALPRKMTKKCITAVRIETTKGQPDPRYRVRCVGCGWKSDETVLETANFWISDHRNDAELFLIANTTIVDETEEFDIG